MPQDEKYSDAEATERMNAAIRRAMNTPHKPHKPLGKRKTKKTKAAKGAAGLQRK